MLENGADLLDDCEHSLDALLAEGATYADMKLYAEQGTQVALRATSSDVQIFDRSLAVARVVYGKAWGIHVVEKPSKVSIKEACRSALKIAKAADSSSILEQPIKLAYAKTVKSQVRHESKVDPLAIEVQTKISLTEDLGKRIKNHLRKSYAWCEVVYGDALSDFSLTTSEGTQIRELTPSVDLLIYVAARSEDIIESASRFLGFTKGYEAIEDIDRDGLVEEVSERALKLAAGKGLKPDLQGKEQAIVMNSDCAGAFVHETVGHPAEADFMLEAGSVFQGKIGKQVATDDLTVYDDAEMKGQYGSYSYDDEAVEARRISLIEKGILRSLLHTRETASEMNTQPTGSAHGLTHVPRCLMSNIYIEARDWKNEELIEETREGCYIQGVVRAQSTPMEGLFLIQPESTIVIRKGQLQETIRGARVTGSALAALKAIDGIGDKLAMRATVEKEFNVSDGGPPIKLSSVRLQ